MRTSFKVKGQGHQTNDHTHNIFLTGRPTKFKLGTDGARRHASATSAVTFKVEGQGRKVTLCVNRCWPISRESNDLATPKLVGRLYTPWAIMRTSFKVKGKGQGHQAT